LTNYCIQSERPRKL